MKNKFKLVCIFEGHTDSVASVAFDPRPNSEYFIKMLRNISDYL